MYRSAEPVTLSAAEQAFQEGRIVEARRLFASWRRNSPRPRTPNELTRAFLLSAHLHLLAGKARPAGRCIGALGKSMAEPLLLSLKAKLSSLLSDTREAIKLMGTAVEAASPEADLALRAALLRQRGLTLLEAGDFPGGRADLAEAARLARIEGDEETLAGALLDMAESALALGDSVGAETLISKVGEFRGPAAIRARNLLRTLSMSSDDEGPTGDTHQLPATLGEAENALLQAAMAAGKGNVPLARKCLAGVVGTGWCEAVEIFRGEASLIKALISLAANRYKEADGIVRGLNRKLCAGTMRRFNAAMLWIRMKAAADLGNQRSSLKFGRSLLRELERKRAGLPALEQLRKISGDYALIYRQMIPLELQCGNTVSAFDALQQFSARALLRRSTTAMMGIPQEALDHEIRNRGIGDPGVWALRRLTSRGKLSGVRTLRWRQAIAALEKLGSD
jgi:tetratricopeptide (TPR) repeat protein